MVKIGKLFEILEGDPQTSRWEKRKRPSPVPPVSISIAGQKVGQLSLDRFKHIEVDCISVDSFSDCLISARLLGPLDIGMQQ